MEVLTHLQRLEAESIHIIREVVAECERPVMLYSVNSLPIVTPFSRPIVTPLGAQERAYPRSA